MLLRIKNLIIYAKTFELFYVDKKHRLFINFSLARPGREVSKKIKKLIKLRKQEKKISEKTEQ